MKDNPAGMQFLPYPCVIDLKSKSPKQQPEFIEIFAWRQAFEPLLQENYFGLVS